MADATLGKIGAQENDPANNLLHSTDVNIRNMVYAQNKSGGSVVDGDVLVLESGTTAKAVTTTTTQQDLRKVVVAPRRVYYLTGVQQEAAKTISSNDKDYFFGSGYVPYAKIGTATTMYEYLVTSTVAKELKGTGVIANGTNLPPQGACAIALETQAAGGNYAIKLMDMTVQSPRHNFTATAAPAVTDDNSSGKFYSVGSLWWDTTNRLLYIAKSVGAGAAVWDRVSTTLFVDTTAVTITNNGAETSIYSDSIPANMLSTNNVIVARVRGVTTNTTAGAEVATIRYKYGATTMATLIFNVPVVTNSVFDVIAVLQGDGATNAQRMDATVHGGLDDNLTTIRADSAEGTAAEDSTLAKTLDITWDWTTVSASLSVTRRTATVDILRNT